MGKRQKRLAVFPGTFDPLTHGHMDVIRRAAALFDELVVAVGRNPDKPSMLPQGVRARIIRRAVADLPNVRVAAFTGLTVDFVRRLRAAAIVRGVRNPLDLQAELQMAMTNRAVAGVETVFLPAGAEHSFVSSSLIRQVARMGGDVSSLVPRQVLPYLRRKR